MSRFLDVLLSEKGNTDVKGANEKSPTEYLLPYTT